MYKVLIVDDELTIRYGLRHYFSWNQIGFEVAGDCENGRQALDYCREHPVDVILSDIKMPVMNGLELSKELYTKKAPIKVVILSGYRDFEFAREALKYDVKYYLLKPTKYEELCRVFTEVKELFDNERGVAEPWSDNEALGSGYYEKIVTMIKTYVHTHYQTATLENASRLVHFNPNYLSKIFKDVTGENFSDFLLQVRMDKAVALLNDATYKTYQISELIGYSNPKNFTRTFKKYYGVTPKEFRHSG